MLGLFIGDRGVSIIEGEDFRAAPERAASPHDGHTEFSLLATDAVELDGECFCVAVYEEAKLNQWQAGVRIDPADVYAATVNALRASSPATATLTAPARVTVTRKARTSKRARRRR